MKQQKIKNLRNREVGKIREKQPIIDYTEHERLKIIECPIISVPESNKSIPDAIISDPINEIHLWLEHTSCIRDERMYGWDALDRKRKTGEIKAHGPIKLSVTDLHRYCIAAISKKRGKDYSSFTTVFVQRKKNQEKGVLLVELRDFGGFLNQEEYFELLELTKDKHTLRILKLAESHFCKIVLTANICTNGKWVKRFDVIWSLI